MANGDHLSARDFNLGAAARALAIDDTGRAFAVAPSGSVAIYQLTATGATSLVTRTVTLPAGASVRGAAAHGATLHLLIDAGEGDSNRFRRFAVPVTGTGASTALGSPVSSNLTGLTFPRGLAITEGGDALTVDQGTTRRIATSAGATAQALPDNAHVYTGFGMQGGRAWIADNSDDQLVVYDYSEGRRGFRRRSDQDFDLAADNAAPHAVAVWQGRAYVSDLQDTKVYVYEVRERPHIGAAASFGGFAAEADLAGPPYLPYTLTFVGRSTGSVFSSGREFGAYTATARLPADRWTGTAETDIELDIRQSTGSADGSISIAIGGSGSPTGQDFTPEMEEARILIQSADGATTFFEFALEDHDTSEPYDIDVTAADVTTMLRALGTDLEGATLRVRFERAGLGEVDATAGPFAAGADVRAPTLKAAAAVGGVAATAHTRTPHIVAAASTQGVSAAAQTQAPTIRASAAVGGVAGAADIREPGFGHGRLGPVAASATLYAPHVAAAASVGAIAAVTTLRAERLHTRPVTAGGISATATLWAESLMAAASGGVSGTADVRAPTLQAAATVGGVAAAATLQGGSHTLDATLGGFAAAAHSRAPRIAASAGFGGFAVRPLWVQIEPRATLGPLRSSLRLRPGAMALWPASLPQDFQASAFTVEPADHVRRHAVEQEGARRARRYTAPIDIWQGRMPMTPGEYDTLFAYYDGYLRRGQRRFFIPSPFEAGKLAEVEFADLPTRARVGAAWEVGFTLRVYG